MISAEKALQIILEHTPTLESIKVSTIDSLGMVLAEDIVAGEDYPPFDKTSIEGFAVRGSDVAKSCKAYPVVLTLDNGTDARDGCEKTLKPGHAVKVAAGAQLPEGADTVVSVDFAVRESAKKVRIYKCEKPGEHIIIRGDDIERGSVVFPKGRIISASDFGVLAAVGVSEVVCYRKPRVSFFATGDDLISPDGPLQQGKIRSCSTYTLQVQLARYGAEPVNLGILDINPEAIKSRIEKALEGDMLIVCSGASGDDFDYLKTILQKYGLDLKFWRVAIKPGKPFVFGTIDSMPVFGFSDNIVSSMVLLEHFIRPSIMKMQGRCEIRRMEIAARLARDIKGGNGMTHFIRAEVSLTEDEFIANPLGSRSLPSANAYFTANGFIVLPPEVPEVSAGQKVKVQIIIDPNNLNQPIPRAAKPPDS